MAPNVEEPFDVMVRLAPDPIDIVPAEAAVLPEIVG